MISDFFPTLLEDSCVIARTIQKSFGLKPKTNDTNQRIVIAALHAIALIGMAYSVCFVGATICAVVTFPVQFLSITLLALFCRDLFVLTKNSTDETLSLTALRSLTNKESKRITNNMAFQPIFRWLYTKPSN